MLKHARARSFLALVTAGLAALTSACGGEDDATNPAAVGGAGGSSAGTGGAGGSGGAAASTGGGGGGAAGAAGSAGRSGGGCPAFPALPDASCTGVPAGTNLTPHEGDLHVTDDGAVIDGLEVSGCIFVEANNVTIKRSKVIRNDQCGWSGAINTGYGEYSGTLIEDVEVDGAAPNSPNIESIALVGVDNYTARRLHVHHGGRAFNVGSNVVIEDSYIHDMYGAGDSHNSGIGSNSGINITIRHNNISCDIGQPGNASNGGGCSGALVLYADTFGDQIGAIDQLVVEENLFNSSSYCMLLYNPRTDGKYSVQNNLFGVSLFPDCGEYGPVDILMTQGATLTWQGNTWYAPGEAKHGQAISPQVQIAQ